MINLGNLSFERAVKTVEYYTTPNKKGKTPLETCENGFTSCSNAIKVLEQYVRMGEFTTPSKHALAKDLLNKIKEEE